MKALVTGASSGIGKDIARELYERGYHVILVARREKLLKELKDELSGRADIYAVDLSKRDECISFLERIKNEDIEVVVNNAGFGLFGKFSETDLERELDMIDVNITSVHIITKSFIKRFREQKRGYILNVASAAAFLPGPLLSAYYATKAYVMRLTLSVAEELRREKSPVVISCLCPGPVKTEFDKNANVKNSLSGLKSGYVARYAVEKLFKKKKIIIPGFKIRWAQRLERLLPETCLARISYSIQNKKQ